MYLTSIRPVIALARTPSFVDQVIAHVGRAWRATDANTLAEGLDSAERRWIVYEAGAFSSSVADQLLATMAVFKVRAPVLICWRGDRRSFAPALDMLMTIESSLLAHDPFTMTPALMRCMTGRQANDICTESIRWLRALGGVDHAVAAALAISEVRRTVPTLSLATAMSVRALSRHCLATGVPRPVSLLGWSRALHVVAALQRGRESVSDIATASGDGTARECADYVKYHTGRAPTSWIRIGGAPALLDAFAMTFVSRPAVATTYRLAAQLA